MNNPKICHDLFELVALLDTLEAGQENYLSSKKEDRCDSQ